MGTKQGGGPHRSQGRSRSNKRIQELEERVALMAKELRQIHEMLGTKVDTKELLACVGQSVSVKDVAGNAHSGVLEKVGKWTISVLISESDELKILGSSSIFFKGNLVRITPIGGADEC